jgi:hypothetical protein
MYNGNIRNWKGKCVYLDVVRQCKKPTAQTAHLVFADTQSQR